MEKKVRKILSDLFSLPIEKIDINTSMETVEDWDSRQHLNLILALEQEFDISLTVDEVTSMTGYKQIISILSGKKLH